MLVQNWTMCGVRTQYFQVELFLVFSFSYWSVEDNHLLYFHILSQVSENVVTWQDWKCLNLTAYGILYICISDFFKRREYIFRKKYMPLRWLKQNTNHHGIVKKILTYAITLWQLSKAIHHFNQTKFTSNCMKFF